MLIIRAKKDPRHWVFPKGHIEKGERPAEAALRELREEAGVDGEIGRVLGTSTFKSGHEHVRVAYFLVRFTRTVPPAESRELQWQSVSEARRLLTFEDARQLLDEVARDV